MTASRKVPHAGPRRISNRVSRTEHWGGNLIVTQTPERKLALGVGGGCHPPLFHIDELCICQRDRS